MFDIVEKFITISGEQPILGTPIYLIRFSGCNLDCYYCDTNYREEINYSLTDDEIINDIVTNINIYPDIKILFTGGEPLLESRQQLLMKIIKKLDNIDFYIETNGSIEIEDFSLNNSHFIVDWKSPSSGFDNSFFINNLKKLRIKNDCIKFVIQESDFGWLKEKIEMIKKINPFLTLYVSPIWGKVELETLANFILKNKLPLNLSVQLHKYIWDPKKRGV